VATYTGNLIATLAVNTVNLPFNSLAEMVKQTKMEWGLPTAVAMVMLFRVNIDKTHNTFVPDHAIITLNILKRTMIVYMYLMY
jgi:hypothetical protein